MIQYTLLGYSKLEVLEVFKKLEPEIPKGHAASKYGHLQIYSRIKYAGRLGHSVLSA